jgi:FtsH-binding integral membrane protein
MAEPNYQNLHQNAAQEEDMYDIEDQQLLNKDVDDSIRRGFIRKVYGLLSFQLLVTVGIVAMMMLVDSVRETVINSSAVMWTGFVLSLVFVVALMCNRHSYPMNMILLLAFTVAESMVRALQNTQTSELSCHTLGRWWDGSVPSTTKLGGAMLSWRP